jgi:hypothetical protein
LRSFNLWKMFCSRSVSIHLLRGIAMIALAVTAGKDHVWLVAPLLIGAIVLMRGCPMCWLTGLFETMAARGQKERPKTTT